MQKKENVIYIKQMYINMPKDIKFIVMPPAALNEAI